jgi:TfoX/Sxy family transcriptional regulator of competence genes
MAYDEGLAEILRAALADEPGISERKMFGGLAFLRHGHMVAGTYRDRGMVRVGKPNEAGVLTLAGVRPMALTGRPMPGLVEVGAEGLADDALLARLLALALDFVRSLPPK